MTAPQPPHPGEQAWSESGRAEAGPGGNPPVYPPTYQFAPHEQHGAETYNAETYNPEAYGAERYPDQAYGAQPYPGQPQPGQQYYGQQPPPPPGYGAPGYPPPPPESKTPGWAWALLGVVIVALLGGLGYFAATQLAGSGEVPAATAGASAQPGGGTTPSAVTPSPRPTTTTTTTTTRAPAAVSVPAGATACGTGMQSAEFPSAAVTGRTSCPFAEEVRVAYLQQQQRDTTVSVRAWSPVTGEWYTMSCTGGDVVRCTGGDNATVYVY